ncbi:MAG: domain, FtsQ-type [Pseudomonadota bacterium]
MREQFPIFVEEAVSASMRVLFTLLITASVVTLHVLDNPQGVQDWMSEARATGVKVWNEKEIRIEGLQTIPRTEIERLLPLDRSVAWWKLQTTSIQGKIAQNPWIGAVEVGSCEGGLREAWGCFLISITERQPTFLAIVDNSAWVIDRGGSFIVPYSDNLTVQLKAPLVKVTGLASRHSSPDVVRAQLSAAANLLDTIEQEVRRQVRGVEFMSHGDLSVAFTDVPFPVVFAAGADSAVPLAEQGKRCAELLKRLHDRFPDIVKVDLAFNRVGVVKFKTPAE